MAATCDPIDVDALDKIFDAAIEVIAQMAAKEHTTEEAIAAAKTVVDAGLEAYLHARRELNKRAA